MSSDTDDALALLVSCSRSLISFFLCLLSELRRVGRPGTGPEGQHRPLLGAAAFCSSGMWDAIIDISKGLISSQVSGDIPSFGYAWPGWSPISPAPCAIRGGSELRLQMH